MLGTVSKACSPGRSALQRLPGRQDPGTLSLLQGRGRDEGAEGGGGGEGGAGAGGRRGQGGGGRAGEGGGDAGGEQGGDKANVPLAQR